jgi:2-haloacid dehalogenase
VSGQSKGFSDIVEKFVKNRSMNPTTEWSRPEVLVFDVYGTLLDMSEVERRINVVTDSKRGYVVWFEMFMQYCFANNSLDSFHDFMSIAKVTLQMTGRELGRIISEGEANDVIDRLKQLPVHEEVQHCLSQLNDEGYRITALTNAPEKIFCDRMERTGLISYFEKVWSAEAVQKYKPDRRVYEWAAKMLNVATSDMLMITSHGWDIAGAKNAGMKTAFIKRSRQLLYPLVPEPDISCKALGELAEALKERNGNLVE